MENGFNVERGLRDFERDIDARLRRAMDSGLSLQELRRRPISEIKKEYPTAVIELQAQDIHFFPVLLKKTVEFVAGKGARRMSTEFGDKKPVDVFNELLEHEMGHVQGVIKGGVGVKGIGVLIAKEGNSLYMTTFVHKEKGDILSDVRAALSPRNFHSGDDIKFALGRILGIFQRK